MKVKLFDNDGATAPMEETINKWIAEDNPTIIDCLLSESSASSADIREAWRACTVLFLYEDQPEKGETESHE